MNDEINKGKQKGDSKEPPFVQLKLLFFRVILSESSFVPE